MTIVLGINLLIGSLLIFFGSYKQVQETTVNITGIRSVKGNVIINVFKDQAGYTKEQPFKKITFPKKSVEKGIMTVKLGLEPGIYGLTLVDDENQNGKIDKNFLGMPKEGFGFSDFFMEKLKKPAFNDFKVDLTEKKDLEIRVKYM